jgi:AbiV family abortive infection protein
MEKHYDYQTGYKLAVESAEAHLKSAKILAKKINYGMGNSHLILAAEEGIKAYMIFVRHFDPSVKVEEFDKYFRLHKFKHKNIAEMMHWLRFFNTVVEVIASPMKEKLKGKKENLTAKDIKTARKAAINALISWLKGIPEIDNDGEWWENADRFKMKGFYVDMDRKTKSWISPKEITEAQYKRSLAIVEEFLERIFMLENASVDPEVLESYERMKGRINNAAKNETN